MFIQDTSSSDLRDTLRRVETQITSPLVQLTHETGTTSHRFNTEHAREILHQIDLRETKQVQDGYVWSQSNWATPVSVMPEKEHPICKTAFCAAGWSAHLSGQKPVMNPEDFVKVMASYPSPKLGKEQLIRATSELMGSVAVDTMTPAPPSWWLDLHRQSSMRGVDYFPSSSNIFAKAIEGHDQPVVAISDAAQWNLGLDYDWADLFGGENTRDDLETIVDLYERTGGFIEVAAMLDHRERGEEIRVVEELDSVNWDPTVVYEWIFIQWCAHQMMLSGFIDRETEIRLTRGAQNWGPVHMTAWAKQTPYAELFTSLVYQWLLEHDVDAAKSMAERRSLASA